MDLFKYLRSRIPGAQEVRHAERAEFFNFQQVRLIGSPDNLRCVFAAQTLYHGFPAKASCFAYDPQLRLLVIGTSTGNVRALR